MQQPKTRSPTAQEDLLVASQLYHRRSACFPIPHRSVVAHHKPLPSFPCPLFVVLSFSNHIANRQPYHDDDEDDIISLILRELRSILHFLPQHFFIHQQHHHREGGPQNLFYRRRTPPELLWPDPRPQIWHRDAAHDTPTRQQTRWVRKAHVDSLSQTKPFSHQMSHHFRLPSPPSLLPHTPNLTQQTHAFPSSAAAAPPQPSPNL